MLMNRAYLMPLPAFQSQNSMWSAGFIGPAVRITGMRKARRSNSFWYPTTSLLGEDGSMDGTRDVAERYAAPYPDRIRLFLHDRSHTVRIDGRPTGRSSFLNNLRHARGRYLCHIDGDDHWTDPDRLRTIVELMDKEPDLGLAFHNAWNTWPDGTRSPYLPAERTKPRFTRVELMADNFIPTSGVVSRWNALQEFAEAFFTGPFGDWVLNIHFAGSGPTGYADRIMSIRNVHGTSSMAAMDNVRTKRGIGDRSDRILCQRPWPVWRSRSPMGST